jgi:site-specific recombinase XerC
MSRAYRKVRPRANIVYSVEGVMTLYSVCRNTVSNWVQSGLSPVDRKIPQLFRGATLIKFHEERRARTRQDLQSGEFKCLGCKAAVFPDLQYLVLEQQTAGRGMAKATCPDCNAIVMKLLNATECNMIRNCLDTNTSLIPSDEREKPVPLHIGKGGHILRALLTQNDRLLYDWQVYAGRHDAKTVDAYLISIRDFERYVSGRPFADIKDRDAHGWRADLIARTQVTGSEGGLSRSTVRHRASNLRAFFHWLAKQNGFKHLASVSGYFALPRGLTAVNDLTGPRAYPTLMEAIQMLAGLPETRLIDRRDRAIFAMAFIAGLRESALISLRMRHVDVTQRKVFHDGQTLRAKNGKSFVIDWFPRTEAFQTVFCAWHDEARALGLRDNDALFPDALVLSRLRALTTPDRPAIQPMHSASTVDAIFRKASSIVGHHYTPHSARHMLANLGDQLCRTSERRKAWSQNLGHETEAITWQHYGRVSAERKADLFTEFAHSAALTDDEKDLMLDYHHHQLDRGSPEFIRATQLVETYKRKS